MPQTFHVEPNKTVNFRAERRAYNQQRFYLDRKDPDTGAWERMGDEYVYVDTSYGGTFSPLSVSTDWMITIENDGGASNWRESKYKELGDGTKTITYRSDDSALDSNSADGDYDDLVVVITLT